MQTHTKEAITTVVAFVTIIGTVHAGIWFRVFGIPDVTVLNWPFHYFWFVVGTWFSLLVISLVYNYFTATVFDAEKAQLHDQFGEHADDLTADGGSD